MYSAHSGQPLHVLVDLTPLLPGGQNGGVKPFIFEYIGWLGRQQVFPLKFTFLTRRCSHAEVRALARFDDVLLCLIDDDQDVEIFTAESSPSEGTWFDAPQDLARRLAVDLLYLPFGISTWHYPGIPTIATIVDVLHRDYPHTLQPHEVLQREAIFQETIGRADLIQGISNYTLDRVFEHYAYPRDRLFCSYIAIHERLTTGNSQVAELPDCPFFFYPANAWKHKNHEVLLLAYRIYRAQAGAEAWHLVLTGHDDERMQNVVQLISTLRLSSHVHYLGHTSPEVLGTIWKKSGALVFPSLHEGFGIPLIEAMAFGVPIITSEAGALREIGGSACISVDARKPVTLAAAMIDVAASSNMRDELRTRGFCRLRDFSFNNDALEFLQRIQSLARKPARQTSCGFYPDGWTAPHAAFTVPAQPNLCTLQIAFRPMPAKRTLRLFHGFHPLGSFTIPEASAWRLALSFFPDGSAVNLDVPDASRLSTSDHRTHGVLVDSVGLRDARGHIIELISFTR